MRVDILTVDEREYLKTFHMSPSDVESLISLIKVSGISFYKKGRNSLITFKYDSVCFSIDQRNNGMTETWFEIFVDEQ
ncbi:hypothetical protein ACFOU2_21005 [Bacillus songklensis]|uniref:Uncharacterized protein n=1 Tax=Bacillus songklensis TaxID=1069116 RepID=A0ABV8B7K9_9BACI